MNENMINSTPKGKNKRLTGAIIRVIVAVVLAVLMLLFTSCSAINLIRGPKLSENLQESAKGDFVNREVYMILGIYGEDQTSSGETTGVYALVPSGGELITVHFTQRYVESAEALVDDTYGFINGMLSKLDRYVTVQGTIAEVTEDESALMYDWFGLNKDQLVEMRMINDTDDYSEYLSDTILLVDTVNYRSQTLVIVLSIIAGILLLYAAVELVLIGTGFYLRERKKGAESCCCGACEERVPFPETDDEPEGPDATDISDEVDRANETDAYDSEESKESDMEGEDLSKKTEEKPEDKE